MGNVYATCTIRSMGKRRMLVNEAARLLGVNVDTIKSRYASTMEKNDRGWWTVEIEIGQEEPAPASRFTRGLDVIIDEYIRSQIEAGVYRRLYEHGGTNGGTPR